MANRGRGFMSGGVWDGEYESQTDIDVKARLDDLEGAVDPGDTGTTYSGVPQPATPYAIPGAQRADPSGKIFTTVRFTSISNNLKRFWLTHKMVRPDGTYGEAQVQRVDVTAAMIAGDSCQVEIEHAFRANRTIHLVKIKGKFTTTVSDDGGNTDQNPPEATYVDEQSPGETSQTELASFSTGAGVVGPQVDNEVYNSKLKYNANNYIKPNGVVDDAGAPATALAMFRHPLIGQQRGGDPTRFVTTAPANLQFWINSGSVAPAIAFTGGSVDQDVCCKTQQTPWDNSEPFMCGAVLLRVGVFSALDLDFSLWVFLEDSVQGRIASARIAGVGAKASSSQWQFVQFDEATVSSSYNPGAASRQWIRWGLRQTSLVGGTLSGGRQILMYKPQAGNMVGAWKPHSNDRVQTNDPTVAPTGGGGRGAAGVGITGHETPAGEGGQVIRGNVN